MKWNSGTPAQPGWYPTRFGRSPAWNGSYRWWDGDKWSWAAFAHETPEKAGRWAAKKEVKAYIKEIVWGEI